MILRWLRRGKDVRRLVQADAEALIRDYADAYGEARERECDAILPDGTSHADRKPEHCRSGAQVRPEGVTICRGVCVDFVIPPKEDRD